MAKFKVEITTGDDAVQSIADVCDVLTDLGNHLYRAWGTMPIEDHTRIEGPVRDVNGNTVGRYSIE